jgi:hypothetical protein
MHSKLTPARPQLCLGKRRLPSPLGGTPGRVLPATDGASMRFGVRCNVDQNAPLIVKHEEFSVGAGSCVGLRAVIACRSFIQVGHNLLFAECVTICGQDDAMVPTDGQGYVGFVTSPIAVGNSAVVRANFVVNHDFSNDGIAAGVPAGWFATSRRIELVSRSMKVRHLFESLSVDGAELIRVNLLPKLQRQGNEVMLAEMHGSFDLQATSKVQAGPSLQPGRSWTYRSASQQVIASSSEKKAECPKSMHRVESST